MLAFDRTSRPVLSFRESASQEPGPRKAVALARIDELRPTWNATDLGQALIGAIAAIEDIADKSERAGRMPRRIVLISDLQQGSRLEALGEFEWPRDVELEVKTVSDDSSNAGLQRLADPVELRTVAADREPRVRVFNDAESRREKFTLQWTDPLGKALGDPVDAYVPPGESRVVRMPRTKAPGTAQSIVLKGDSAPFDNTLFVVDEPRQEATVLFIGDDRADDVSGLLYYLMRVFVDTPRRIGPGHPAAAVGDGHARSQTSDTAGDPGRRDQRRERPPPPRSRPSRLDRPLRGDRPRPRRDPGGAPRCPVRADRGVAGSRRPDRRDRLRSPALRSLRRAAVQRLHQDPLLEAPQALCEARDAGLLQRDPVELARSDRASWRGSTTAIRRSSRRHSTRGASSSWPAAGAGPTASSRVRRSSSR